MRVPPPVIALAGALAQRALTPGMPQPSCARKAAAGTVAASSMVLMGTAMREFRDAGTTVDPLQPERASALVTNGPFRITRNPMYVGLTGLLLMHALLRGSPRALTPVAAFALVIDRFQITAEEVAMSSLFGGEYDAYRSRVRRWL